MTDDRVPLIRIIQRASHNEFGEDSVLIGKIAGLFLSARFDRGIGPFICGTWGEQEPDGLHQGYVICPTYGADIQCSAVYKKQDRTKVKHKWLKPLSKNEESQ